MTSTRAGAALVAAGIFLSRVAGFVREAAFAWAFGSSDAADAFKAALRIPNFLQNLFGEGALSGSFIPVYRKVLDEDPAAAARLSGVVVSLLSLATAVLVLAGVAGAPLLVDLLAPGFEGEKRDATIEMVRVLFPGTGLLVGSAWCLGVLNAHAKDDKHRHLFFLSYVAPVAWNAAIIAALLVFRGQTGYPLARLVAWGAVVGSALQLLVMLPAALRLSPGLRPALDHASPHVRRVLRTFAPQLVSRGVVQVSAFLEEVLASFLVRGSIAGIAYAQIIYTLPVSLFGMSVAASELPNLASEAGDRDKLAARLAAGARRIAFFVVPSAVAFAALGDCIASVLFERGKFTHADALVVHAILAGAAVGLVASTQSRLVTSAFQAFEDTRTPLFCAIARVSIGTGLGAGLALWVPGALGVDPRYAPAGLTLGTSVGAVVELALLRARLRTRVDAPGVPASYAARLFAAALAAAAAGFGAKLGVAGLALPGVVRAAVPLVAFGAVYGAVTLALGVPEAQALIRRLRRR